MTIPEPDRASLSVSWPSAVLLVGAVLGWVAQLLTGPVPWPTESAALLAAGLVLLHGILAVATLLAPGRWVSASATLVGLAELGLALTIPLSVTWWVAVALTAGAVTSMWRRSLVMLHAAVTRPDRVPPVATALAVGLMALPAVVGAAGVEGVTAGGWVLAGAGVLLGWAYMRALVSALWVIRIALPVLGVWAGLGMPPAAGVAIAAVSVALTALAWTKPALAAANPLAPERVKPVPILPEMVPPELLEAAGFDAKGRPKKKE